MRKVIAYRRLIADEPRTVRDLYADCDDGTEWKYEEGVWKCVREAEIPSGSGPDYKVRSYHREELT